MQRDATGSKVGHGGLLLETDQTLPCAKILGLDLHQVAFPLPCAWGNLNVILALSALAAVCFLITAVASEPQHTAENLIETTLYEVFA